MFGTGPFATTPFATEPGADLSVLPPFLDLLANPDADRFLRLDVEPWSPAAGAVVQMGYGSGNDSPLRAFGPYLIDALNYETRIFDSLSGVARSGSPTVGDITLAFGDGRNDHLCRYRLGGRRVRVLMGGANYTDAQYQEIFVGTARHSSWTPQKFSIALRDPSELVAGLVQTNRYAGTGGLEGAADLKGKVKPKAWGPFWNAPGEMVDRTALIGQIHDGSMDSITDIFDRAVALVPDGDEVDEAALRAWVPTPFSAKYRTCLALGLYRLADAPAGLVTVNGTGDDTGGYVDTAAGIARRIFQAQGGLADSALELSAFAQLDTDQPARVGIFVNSEAQLLDVVDLVLASIFGWRNWTRTGLITVGRLEFGTPAAEIGASDVDDIFDVAQISTEAPELPARSISLGYRRVWARQGPEEVASLAADAQKEFVKEEFRRATWTGPLVAGENALDEEQIVDTLLADEADAQDEADRRGALLGSLSLRYALVVKGHQFRLRPGQTVTLKHHRFGLSAGQDFIILRLGENTTTRRTALGLWGVAA